MVVYYIVHYQLQSLHTVFHQTLVRYKFVFCFWILLHISCYTLCTLPKVPIYHRLIEENDVSVILNKSYPTDLLVDSLVSLCDIME